MFHRRLVVTIIVVLVMAISTGAVAAGSHRGAPRSTISAKANPVDRSTKRARKTQPVTTHQHLKATPSVVPPNTATQRQIDNQLAQAETPASIAAARATMVPGAAVSIGYPSIPTSDRSDPTAYGLAFATELLDTNYSRQSRSEEMAWAEHEEAPNTLPGVPSDVAGKALVLSLADPGLPGGTPSPTPTQAQWATDGTNQVSQLVSDLQAETDPDWTEIVSEGWQPVDPLMTIETITGTLTVTTMGQASSPESFSLTLTLGSATHVQAGYGAVAAGDWTLN
jgi:hypothetical protein